MKRILFPTDFLSGNECFCSRLAFAKNNTRRTVLHSYPLPIDDQFFPENFNMVYDTVELTEFDMFKEEIPKLRAIAEACNLENIKMSHRLMEGDLIANIKKIVDTDKIDYVVMGTSGVNRLGRFVGSNSGDVIIGIWLLLFMHTLRS
jgi:nucleotide-binding universal stress UspA family protein